MEDACMAKGPAKEKVLISQVEKIEDLLRNYRDCNIRLNSLKVRVKGEEPCNESLRENVDPYYLVQRLALVIENLEEANRDFYNNLSELEDHI